MPPKGAGASGPKPDTAGVPEDGACGTGRRGDTSPRSGCCKLQGSGTGCGIFTGTRSPISVESD
jgi:hypothetical protein